MFLMVFVAHCAFSRPGVLVKASSATYPDATTMRTGTSFAAGFVSGVAALMLQAFPSITPAEILNRIQYGAAANVLSNATNFPNRLLSTEFIDDFSRAPSTIPPLVTKTPRPVPGPTQVRPACGTILLSGCVENDDCCSRRCWRFFLLLGGHRRCWFFSNV
jgi:Subtilase family